ncbi:PsiF family protein [Paracraurococcus lichenis]|uniref:PsiF family protein n=1 Tax=Paracraurococcus lichenis TaxID=3064888 RepID=A0ABT9DTT8_9PROT|nr:PsiF family protein [Paracraurococcus sp. LOR1-02]MDO9707319.1 PsiF family protein [Paracraurococcus sp. LOR1-02]
MRGAALAALAAGLFLAAGPALAQTAPPAEAQRALTAPQQRMQGCNAEAGRKSLAGEARQKFMSDCLSGNTTEAQPALTAQQERMKTCQAEATTRNLSGEARQRYVNGCLSGNAATGANAAPAPAGNGGRFASEAEAKRTCGGDAVVWANPDSKVFHAAGTQFYGKTQQGGYMCRPAAEKAGFRAAAAGRS